MASIVYSPNECEYLIKKYEVIKNIHKTKHKELYDKSVQIHDQFTESFSRKSRWHTIHNRNVSRNDIINYAYGYQIYSESVRFGYPEYSMIFNQSGYNKDFEHKFFSYYNITEKFSDDDLALCNKLSKYYYVADNMERLILKLKNVIGKEITLYDDDIKVIGDINKQFFSLIEYDGNVANEST